MSHRTIALIFVTLFLATCMSAQEVKQLSNEPTGGAFGPGDTLHFEVTFGEAGKPDASIQSVIVRININDNAMENQRGFALDARGSTGSPTRPGVFEVEVRLPRDIASGDYVVTVGVVSALGAKYDYLPSQTKVGPIHIKNPATSAQPPITVTLKPPSTSAQSPSK